MRAFVSAFVAATLATAANAVVVTVDGTDNIFAAGLGAIPPLPGGSGTLPPGIAVVAGETLTITATGLIDCCSAPPGIGPNGLGTPSVIVNTTGSAIGGYNDATGAFALAGAFTGGAVDTSVFKIGANLVLVVPAGATMLWLGIPDAFGFNGNSSFYDDNSGSFRVVVDRIPEPATWAMLISGFGLVGLTMRRRRQGMASA